MFLIDKPYISDFFKKTVKENNIPVVATETAKGMGLHSGTYLISEDEAVEHYRSSERPLVYTSSENAIGWISEKLSFSDLPAKIELFKNKLTFRRLTQSLFPDFYFKEIRAEELSSFRIEQVPLPFVIKPAVGFFSIGVYKISEHNEWGSAVRKIQNEINIIQSLYPEKVLDARSFIIEECINGEEYAVDAYYNASGEPVILGIFHHPFSSGSDVSDRVYITSKDIIKENLSEFTDFAQKLGTLTGVKNFPVHMELRRDSNGKMMPIEVNPVRFGGWCTTADITFLAFDFNPYMYFYLQKKPDWKKILKDHDDRLFSIVVLDNSTGISADKISSFNYKKLLSSFEKPLDLRKIDYKEHSVFGFLFTESKKNNISELMNILQSDLKEYVAV